MRGIAQDITAQARHINVPVAVLAGEHDKVEPPAVLRECLLPHIPHATLTTVPGAGHLLPLEAPEAIADALADFLATAAAPPARHGAGPLDHDGSRSSGQPAPRP